jgi:hypothetical protein
MKIFASFILLLALTSLSPASDKTRESQEDDIREAVFRYQFGPRQHGSYNAYYVGIGEKATDPSDKFMMRFAEHRPPVRKYTAWHFVRGSGAVDNKTGEQGLVFTVASSIKWISDTQVEVQGGYYENEESASWNTYTLKKDNGKWRVIKDKLEAIS